MPETQTKQIGVIANPEVSKKTIQKIVERLTRNNATIYYDPQTAEKLNVNSTPIKDMNIDVAVILGGDGTLLWAVNQLKKNPLILGINTGRIGYLTEIRNLKNLKQIDRIFTGKYIIDERTKLKVNNKYEALNEAVIVPQKPASLMEFKININKEDIINFRADGLLISTPTGSTGHALSLGGPIIHPESNTYLIIPMISFMQEQHPLIVPDTFKTIVEFTGKHRDGYLIIDGNITKKLRHTETVTIEKSNRKTRFIRFTRKKWTPKITDIGHLR